MVYILVLQVHGLYSCTLFPVLIILYIYIPVLSCALHALLCFSYHDVHVHYLELYFAPLLIGYVAGEMEALCDTFNGREPAAVVEPSGVAID
ncbi:hypothetical protein M6B38_301695 [Iris pallida]|uniref:Uncharacterized protein n=1 Tax=Iris pallida TaxID=29817 RepID=A0AAX6HNY8_IRIPA|nr:hypothetical protein M6B38_301695 [Iris pallida]